MTIVKFVRALPASVAATNIAAALRVGANEKAESHQPYWHDQFKCA